jgi:hypothetical protein
MGDCVRPGETLKYPMAPKHHPTPLSGGDRKPPLASVAKRLLIFVALGPILVIALLSLMSTAIGLYSFPNSSPMTLVLLRGVFHLVLITLSIGAIILGLIAAAVDSVMTHWNVGLYRRMILSGAAVGFLASNSEAHFSKITVAVGVVGGCVVALCIWLNDKIQGS